MGRNSSRRRAGRRGRPGPAGAGRTQSVFGTPRPSGARRAAPPADDDEVARAAVRAAVFRLDADGLTGGAGRAAAEAALRSAQPVSASVVARMAHTELDTSLAGALAGGWGPGDLVELIARSGDPVHLPALLTGLYAEARANPARGEAWQSALATLGADPRWRLVEVDQLASALVVTALLTTAPLLRVDDFAAEPDAGSAHPKLARVRALLAKAESTTFPEEAEALSAKAQELIARYSLDDLLARASRRPGAGDGFGSRRIWLDPPYLRAKSSLVAAVAAANHVQTAWAQRHGFAIVVGARHDLDAVELLVTSLLVQADRAMLAHGRRSDVWGTSRTRSFRQSFLEAYAARVGQRLHEAGEAAVADDPDRFLPALRGHDERVRAAFDAMVPHQAARARRVSNHEGWTAGLAAGDLAQLGVRGRLAEQDG